MTLSPDPDAALVRRLQGGDKAAFEELYERYKGKVYNTCLRITGNSADAADVAQEVFVAIYKKIGLFAFRSSFSTWVYRMSVNAGIDRYRKVTRHPAASTDDPEFQETGEFRALADQNAASADKEAERHEFDKAVKKTINLLPVKLRAAVVLRYLQNLSYQEVAAALRCSEGTVKSRLNRAHEKLRGMLGKVMKAGDMHAL